MNFNARYRPVFSVLLLISCFVLGPLRSEAGRRSRPGNSRGVYQPRRAPESRRVNEPRFTPEARAVYEPKNTPAARAVYENRPPPVYARTLPAGFVTRAYGGFNYYYSEGVYYYEYTNDGPPLYVPATVVNGVPTVPPRPYIYTLPVGSTLVSVGGVSYYFYHGYYYYVYYINGQAVYVLAATPGNQPSVPPAPY